MTFEEILKLVGAVAAVVTLVVTLFIRTEVLRERRARARLIATDRRITVTHPPKGTPMGTIESSIRNDSDFPVSGVRVKGVIKIHGKKCSGPNIGQMPSGVLTAGQETQWLNMDVSCPQATTDKDVKLKIIYRFTDKDGKRWKRVNDGEPRRSRK